MTTFVKYPCHVSSSNNSNVYISTLTLIDAKKAMLTIPVYAESLLKDHKLSVEIRSTGATYKFGFVPYRLYYRSAIMIEVYGDITPNYALSSIFPQKTHSGFKSLPVEDIDHSLYGAPTELYEKLTFKERLLFGSKESFTSFISVNFKEERKKGINHQKKECWHYLYSLLPAMVELRVGQIKNGHFSMVKEDSVVESVFRYFRGGDYCQDLSRTKVKKVVVHVKKRINLNEYGFNAMIKQEAHAIEDVSKDIIRRIYREKKRQSDREWEEKNERKYKRRILRSSSDLKPIPTWYNDVLYDSQNEARVAYLLDLLTVDFIPHNEGYIVNGEWYAPDFFISKQKCFIEAKSADTIPDKDLKKIFALADAGQDVFVINDWLREICLVKDRKFIKAHFYCCNSCNSHYLAPEWEQKQCPYCGNRNWVALNHDQHYEQALKSARNARYHVEDKKFY